MASARAGDLLSPATNSSATPWYQAQPVKTGVASTTTVKVRVPA